jgi:FixJ family two-component response regulator
MPGGRSGFDLAQWIASNRPELAVLLTSGFSEDLMPEHVPGAPKVLRKPYTQAELATNLHAAIEAKAKADKGGGA